MKNWDSKDIILWAENVKKLRKPKDFISSVSPSIKKLDEDQVTIFLIGKIGKNLLKWFPSIEITQDQIEIIAEVIFDDYSDLKIDEIDYFFKKVAKGDYGPVYGNLDPSTILQKLKVYCDQTGQMVQQHRERMHQQAKGFRSMEKKKVEISNIGALETLKMITKSKLNKNDK